MKRTQLPRRNIHKNAPFVEERELTRLKLLKKIWLNNSVNLNNNLDNYY